MRKYRTSSDAFRWRTVIYSLGDIRLPRGIPIEIMLYFVAFLGLMALIHNVTGLTVYNGPIHYIGIPVLLTYFASQVPLEDKKSMQWIRDTLQFFFSQPKEQWCFEKPEKYSEGSFSSITYRK